MNITDTEFKGSKAIEIRTSSLIMTIVIDYGPRIAAFGRPGGSNLLFWDDAGERARGEWRLRGGHRVWVTRPYADESMECYTPDNRACEVLHADDSVIITGSADPVYQIRRGIRIQALTDEKVMVDNFCTNTGAMLWSGGIWALTCTDPAGGKTYGVPLGDGSAWDAFSVAHFKKWAGAAARVNDPQVVFTEDICLIRPDGVTAKKALEARQGIIGCHVPEEKISFFKKMAYDKNARYPMNCNIAFYIGAGNFMVEMETMGGETTLAPGETVLHEELWVLTPEIDWADKAAITKACLK